MKEIIPLNYPFKFTEKEKQIFQRICFQSFLREKKSVDAKEFFLNVCEQVDQNRSI